MNEDIHVGEMIEEVIRSNRISISDVARKIHVNRRSVYNWFKQKSLRPYTLHRICYVLVHDFSVKLPAFFNDQFIQNKEFAPPASDRKADVMAETESNSVQYWINKYIFLLEKYNETLAKGVTKEDKLTERKK